MAGRLDKNQDLIIEQAINGKAIMTLFLKNGVPMKGRILAHDAFTVFMQTDRYQALIFKHSVTSLFPARLRPPGSGGGYGDRHGGGHGGHGGGHGGHGGGHGGHGGGHDRQGGGHGGRGGYNGGGGRPGGRPGGGGGRPGGRPGGGGGPAREPHPFSK